MKIMLSKFLLTIVIGSGLIFPAWLSREENINFKTKAAIIISTDELFDLYNENEIAADRLFLNKKINVTGTVSSIDRNEFGEWTVLFLTNGNLEGVSCILNKHEIPFNIASGNNISLKGKCNGVVIHVCLSDCTLEK